MSKTGYSSNHGMQTINVKQELAKEDSLLVEKNKGFVAYCPYCGTEYRLNKKEYSYEHIYMLQNYFRGEIKEGKVISNCPHCSRNDFTGHVVQHCFVVQNEDIFCVKVPAGFKSFKNPISYDEQKAKASKGTIKV